jgi:Holliday junction resolvase
LPNKSKAKGNRFEKQLVDAAKAAGLEAVRAWGSNGKALGHHEEVDIVLHGYKVQAKSRAKLPDYIKPNENVDVQIIKADRESPFVVMKFDQWLELIK